MESLLHPSWSGRGWSWQPPAVTPSPRLLVLGQGTLQERGALTPRTAPPGCGRSPAAGPRDEDWAFVMSVGYISVEGHIVEQADS